MLSGALPELLCIYIYIYIASLRRLAGRTALSLKRTTGPMVDRRSRWLCQPAHMARELFRDLVWSASSDELVQGEGHLVLGTGVLHILPGYGCGVGHGADVRHATLSPTYDRGTCVKPGKFRVLLTVCLNLMPI